MKGLVSVLILGAGAGLLSAQTMIEYGASAGRAGASASAAGAGKGAAAAFGRVTQALSGAAKASDEAKPSAPSAPSAAVPSYAPVASAAAPAAASSSPVITVSSAPAAQKEEPLKPADLTALKTGMDRDEMLEKVGKPSMSLSSLESSTMVETCWYKNGSDSVTVTLRDGKVASISGAPEAEAK